MRTVDVV
jgi:large subunit ribosomal protein L34